MKYIFGIFALLAIALLTHAPAFAADSSLQLQPLEYRETLKPAEKKRGYVDITNPQTIPIFITASVQGFRQTDSHGNLTFYNDERLSSGIQLDETKAEIPAHKTLRLYFIVDGTKLPTGDVFAAIFVRTASKIDGAANPSVQLGTLLILTNGTPSTHTAQITSLQIPLISTNSSITGTVAIKNTAPANSSNGFFPSITVRSWPFGPATTIQGPLVYAGITRTVSFHEPTGQVGIYRISASYGSSHQDRWIILLPGPWIWIVLAVIALLIIGFILYIRQRRRKIPRR